MVTTIGGTGLGIVAMSAGAAVAAPMCSQAGDSGFTAAVVATSGQRIVGRRVNATGCDVGIYVGPGAKHVRISRVRVTGAKDAGILVQDTSHVTITRSVVTGNGFASPGELLPEAFAISLFGVSDSRVSGNTVYNNGRGGIGLMDYGPFDPGQLVTHQPDPKTAPVPSDNDVVSRNRLWANYNGCAIVLAPFNVGNHMSNDVVTRNTVRGVGANRHGADVGGIVAQTNGPASTVSNIRISRNRVTGSAEAGVIVHAAAPNSKTVNVSVTGNRLSGDNWAKGAGPHPSQPTQLTGVVVDSLLEGPNGARAIDTVVARNRITDEFYGVWSRGANAPVVRHNSIHVLSGGTPVYRVPAP
ncbi:MAG: right-handed parallel beta-helix repeat-containing protein [Intrasporangium sp.]|uniref:right-handed parallel beta-helix repeat-containing protein n=1 Tax=Intrasporangium sp. TaxID=1925024 RepID=UPI0026479D80|nr:right-handed parallel beta-helix repeat-containing protein [Intrasporangium sp.]MDN5797135.1 right-handed parallel beta-helix repeat-containing protein [Intrasporangium sp.]